MSRWHAFTAGLLLGMAPILADLWPRPAAMGEVRLVPATAIAQTFDAERYCAALAVFTEARGESPQGEQAVARVVDNRVRDGRWGNTACAVVTARRQFAGVARWKGRPLPWTVDAASWRDAWNAVEAAQNGTYPACMASATHFDSTRFKVPTWAHSMTHLCTVGLHRFYKEKR